MQEDGGHPSGSPRPPLRPQKDTSSVDPQKALGLAVRSVREEQGLSQEDLAQRAGLPSSLLAHLESGDHDPTWGDMRRLAEGLEISLEELSELAEAIEFGEHPPSPS